MLLKESTRYVLQRPQGNPDILISPEDLGERDYLVICMDGDSTLLTSDWLQRSPAKSSPSPYVPSTTRPPASAAKRIRSSSEGTPSYVTDSPSCGCCIYRPGSSSIHPSPGVSREGRFRIFLVRLKHQQVGNEFDDESFPRRSLRTRTLDLRNISLTARDMSDPSTVDYHLIILLPTHR